MELQSENKIAVIDADSIGFIAHWDSINKTFNKPLQEILLSVDKIISNILINTKATHFVGYVSYGKSAYRSNIYPQYKANRDHLIKPEYLNDTKHHMVDKWQFKPLFGIETDDVVNTVRLKTPNSFLCALDKDLLHLEGTHWNYKTNSWVTTSKQKAIFEFWSDMITGQPSDNIKGIEGKGKQFATTVLEGMNDLDLIRGVVLNCYIDKYGEQEGIEKFYQNYSCLKIKDNLNIDNVIFTPVYSIELIV